MAGQPSVGKIAPSARCPVALETSRVHSSGALRQVNARPCHMLLSICRFGPVYDLELRRANGEGRSDQWVRLAVVVSSPPMAA